MCASACVSYVSTTQESVTLSSTEAEYVAMSEGVEEEIFLRFIWSFVVLGVDVGVRYGKGQRRRN